MLWTGFKEYEKKYEPQNVWKLFREVFSRIFKILIKFIAFFFYNPKKVKNKVTILCVS